MAKKETKKVEKVISKKDLRKKIEMKLEAALLDIKGDIETEKFNDLLKKAGKLLVTGIYNKSTSAVEPATKPNKVKNLKAKKTTEIEDVED